MCFSAGASFTASSVLLLTGGYSLFQAIKHNPKYIFLALVPLLFAIQQAIEGGVWLDLKNQFLPLAYLFFAYFIWPPFIGLSVYAIEENQIRKKILFYLSLFGLLVGLTLYLPLVFKIYHIEPMAIQHSICYRVQLSSLYMEILGTTYLAVLFFETMLSSNKLLKVFGIGLILSYIFTYIFYVHAFTSVWCFFGAILSTLIAFMIPKKRVSSCE
jgi:hypothetical protein